MRILIVDDDDALTRTLARMLKHHVVVTARDARRGIDLVAESERAGVRFDVVLCDETMPGLCGRHLVAALRGHIDTPILILMSGAPATAEMRRGADEVLLKPFRSGELLEAIRRAEESRSRSVTARLAVHSG